MHNQSEARRYERTDEMRTQDRRILGTNTPVNAYRHEHSEACAHALMPACRHVRREGMHACMRTSPHARWDATSLRIRTFVSMFARLRVLAQGRSQACAHMHAYTPNQASLYPRKRACPHSGTCTSTYTVRIRAHMCAGMRPSAYAFMDAMHTVHAHTARTHMPLAYAHHIPSHADTHSYLQYIGMSADTRVRGTRSRARGHIPAHVNIHAHMNACMHTGSENA
jgi:hypothetical protein